MTEVQFRLEKFDAVLELTVLGGVDERIDTAVGENHHGRDVVVPTSEAGGNSVEVDDDDDVVWSDTHDESAADHQRCDKGIASGSVQRGIARQSHLKLMVLISTNIYKSINQSINQSVLFLILFLTWPEQRTATFQGPQREKHCYHSRHSA